MQSRHLGRGGESVGTALVGVVHELLQVLQVLQQQCQPQLVGVVAVAVSTRPAPCTQLLLLRVQAVSRQAPDDGWETIMLKNCFWHLCGYFSVFCVWTGEMDHFENQYMAIYHFMFTDKCYSVMSDF